METGLHVAEAWYVQGSIIETDAAENIGISYEAGLIVGLHMEARAKLPGEFPGWIYI